MFAVLPSIFSARQNRLLHVSRHYGSVFTSSVAVSFSAITGKRRSDYGEKSEHNSSLCKVTQPIELAR